ncbi:MAG: redoxin domain-containing protein, partial [Bradymonadaceae bacterium]
MMPKLQARCVGSACIIATALVFGLQACDKQEASEEGNEAEAVEANDKTESAKQAQKNDGSKEGAAAEKGGEAGENEKAEAPETATVGKPAPDFTLVDANGNKHSLSDYEGKTVVLEWTSPECPYVQRHYKEGTMSTTREKLGGKEKVVWLAIDSSNFNTPKKSKKWKEKHGIEKPILQDKDGKVGKKYGAKTTPHMYVIDPEGVLRYRGAIDDDPKGDKKPEARTNY